MDKLVEHGIRMLEIEGKGKNDGYIETRNMGDIARAVYDTILRVQVLERKADRKTEPSNSEIPNNCEPKICDTCRYYNSNIPCGSTPSACKEADKFAEEFVDGLKKLKPKVEPQTENLFTDKYGDVWEWRGDAWYCISGQTEPQTEREGE